MTKLQSWRTDEQLSVVREGKGGEWMWPESLGMTAQFCNVTLVIEFVHTVRLHRIRCTPAQMNTCRNRDI